MVNVVTCEWECPQATLHGYLKTPTESCLRRLGYGYAKDTIRRRPGSAQDTSTDTWRIRTYPPRILDVSCVRIRAVSSLQKHVHIYIYIYVRTYPRRIVSKGFLKLTYPRIVSVSKRILVSVSWQRRLLPIVSIFFRFSIGIRTDFRSDFWAIPTEVGPHRYYTRSQARLNTKADRGTASAALKSEFFTTKPFACDPSSLPKYPPSKEMDAKMRDEECRRQRAAGGKVRISDGTRKTGIRDRESRAVPAPEANAELPMNLQKRRLLSQSNAKSKSEKFPPPHEDGAVGFPIEPRGDGQQSFQHQ
ncbi:hypothetical protein KI387_009868, partial [Taxus chinensis]